MSDFREQIQTENAADEKFLAGVKQRLDYSCDVLDVRTVSRLKNIRHTALEPKPKRFSPLWLSFGGMVTATFLVFSLNLSSLQLPGWTTNGEDAAPLEDIEILTTTESLDFYEEYEFYQWLAENDSSGL
ncbi:MAG: hypothetical protein V4628_06405 [Pseudomonadota bacterium]